MGDAGVPDVQRAHLGVFAQVLAIAGRARHRRIAAGGIGKPIIPGGEHEGGDEALEIPFPWGRQGLVEIVDVEQNIALRRGEAPEIHQVAIAAGLHMDAGDRGLGEIRRHDRRGAAIEGEGRLEHSAITDRQQPGHAALVRSAQDGERIDLALAPLPGAMQPALHLVSQCTAGSQPVSRGDVGGNERRFSTGCSRFDCVLVAFRHR